MSKLQAEKEESSSGQMLVLRSSWVSPRPRAHLAMSLGQPLCWGMLTTVRASFYGLIAPFSSPVKEGKTS